MEWRRLVIFEERLRTSCEPRTIGGRRRLQAAPAPARCLSRQIYPLTQAAPVFWRKVR